MLKYLDKNLQTILCNVCAIRYPVFETSDKNWKNSASVKAVK
jgi:exo-beta-1,3-glucanase (GH17 family)